MYTRCVTIQVQGQLGKRRQLYRYFMKELSMVYVRFKIKLNGQYHFLYLKWGIFSSSSEKH